MATGVGMSFDLDALDKAIVKADNNLRKLAQDAEVQSKRISDAFSIGAAKGISQFAKEIANARGGISKLMAEGAEFKFTANGAKGFSAKVIDEINKVINYSRKEFENLNATITRSMLIKPTLDVNSIKELENRLVILNQGLATGMLGQGKGKKKIAVDDDLRVRINDEIKAINERLSILRMSTAQFNQMKAQEATAIINNVKLEQEAIEAGKRRAQDAIQNYKRELDAARNAYRERKQMYEQLFKEQEKQMSQNRRASYNLSMKGGDGFASADNAIRYTNRLYSEKGLRNINNMNLAIQKMQQAQQRLNLNTEQGRQKYEQLDKEIKRVKGDIDRVTGASENLKKSHSKLLDTSGQLARALAAVFSVSAIKGYVNKLMQIRGEFELQQRSLQVLLQNKDEANALWDKTVELAVKSPYTTKQLVTATKQLAAYRVESEKLYETNKMLADVSIGLGVDMNRLILAFGQVKAANFLRGTELRQFSEAGVNMLDELAKRFTALEGRAVSVGEVFERVSKRMVSFADVEAVFKTITSEGGTFYQMQEKQSETLKGMMLNLKDSYELMLNDIGKSNESTLKGFVSMMKTLVDNWRDLAPFINTAGVALITYFGTGVLKGIAKYSAMILNIWKAHPFLAVASAILTVVTYIISAKNAVDELTAAMREVEKNVTESLEESIGLYRKLTDTINDSTASLDERNEAYENLKTKFKDILPDQLTELKYIESLAFNYKAAEDAMFSYYNAKAKQQKKDKIEALYEADFNTDESDLVNALRERITERRDIAEIDKTYLLSGLSGAVNKAIESIKSGKIKNDFDSLKKEIEKNLEIFSGKNINIMATGYAEDYFDVFTIDKNLKELVATATKYKDSMAVISGMPYETYSQKVAFEAMQEHNKEMESAVSLYNHLISLRQKLADNKIDLTSDKSTLNEKQLQDREWYLNDLNNTLNEINKLSPDVANGIKEIDKSLISAAEKGSYEFAKSLGVAENALYNIFVDKTKTLKGGDEGASAMLTNYAEGIKANAESKLATPLQQAIISAFDLAIKERDIDQKGKDLLAKLIPDSKQTTEDVRKSVEALLKQYQDEVKKWTNATSAGATKLPFVEYLNQFGNTEFKSAISQYLGSTEDLKNLEQKMIPVLEHINRLLGGDPKKDKKGSGRDIFAERLRVIKEIYQAYKDLSKTLDDAGAKEGAMQKFGNAFKEAFGKTPEQMGFDLFSEEGVKKAYDYLIKNAPNAKKKIQAELAKGEIVLETKVRLQQEEDKEFADQIADMFSGYELSLELEKLNIPRDLAQRLFGVETFDLSQIREKLEKEIANAEKQGGREDFIAKRKEELEKVKDMEIKQQRELLKTYSKYLVQAQSERIKIKLDELRQLKEIESLEIGDADKELMRQGVKKDIQKRLDTQAWKDFQESGMYVRLFDNLEGASMRSLDKMENTLIGLRDSLKDLDPSELKEINNQVEKIRDIKVDKNPFRGLTDDAKTYFEYVKNRKDWEASLDASEAKEADLRSKADEQSLYIKSLEDEIDLIDQSTIEGENLAIVMADKVELEKANLKVLLDELEAQGKITKAERERIEKGQDAGKSMQDRLNKTAQDISAVTSSMADMATNLEAAFGMSDGLKDAFELLQGVGGGVSDMFSGAAGLISGNPLQMVQGGMQLVGGVSKIFNSFNEAYDKRKERQIQREIKLVERLGKLYEKLDKQIDTAYSIDTFQAANDAAKENLEEQIRATERMIEAEKDKKDTDHKRIEEWEEQIENNLEMLEELEAKRLQELGGVGGEDAYKDVAQGFTDAWFDAFLETGDGLDALNDHFDEVLNNIVKKQLALRATNSFLAPIFEEIDKAVKDTKVTNEEMQKIKELASQTMPELAAFLENIATEMGMSEYAGKNGELSGLSAGIQGVSEETANILASYMNSIRFYVADSNTQLKALVAAQEVNADTPNPMLSQLLTIAEQTRAIRDMFESVIGRGGNNKHSGAYLKVDMG